MKRPLMKPQRRNAVSRALRGYRRVSGASQEETAKLLGWPLGVYTLAEDGLTDISSAQRNAVKKLIRAAIKKSAPADVHYRGYDRQYNDEQRNDGRIMVECGVYPLGDEVVKDFKQTPAVTCERCKLTVAYLNAVALYGRK